MLLALARTANTHRHDASHVQQVLSPDIASVVGGDKWLSHTEKVYTPAGKQPRNTLFGTPLVLLEGTALHREVRNRHTLPYTTSTVVPEKRRRVCYGKSGRCTMCGRKLRRNAQQGRRGGSESVWHYGCTTIVLVEEVLSHRTERSWSCVIICCSFLPQPYIRIYDIMTHVTCPQQIHVGAAVSSCLLAGACVLVLGVW